MPYEHQVTRRVEFSETDMAGIMHFSNFFRFMETAECGFFRALGYSVVLGKKQLALGLPRVHAECDYEAPLRFEDEVLIHLLVERKGKTSITYQFRFYRLDPSGPTRVARGRVTAVCVARDKEGSMKAATIPAELAALIEQAPAELLAGHHPPARKTPARTHPTH
jgi:YbgC/YbaW family acyl-CoA thioester hydrolase